MITKYFPFSMLTKTRWTSLDIIDTSRLPNAGLLWNKHRECSPMLSQCWIIVTYSHDFITLAELLTAFVNPVIITVNLFKEWHRQCVSYRNGCPLAADVSGVWKPHNDRLPGNKQSARERWESLLSVYISASLSAKKARPSQLDGTLALPSDKAESVTALTSISLERGRELGNGNWHLTRQRAWGVNGK